MDDQPRRRDPRARGLDVNEADLEKLDTAARLQDMGVVVRSPELRQLAADLNAFHANQGNRTMRRAAAKRARRKR